MMMKLEEEVMQSRKLVACLNLTMTRSKKIRSRMMR